jgi:hypothetical protein
MTVSEVEFRDWDGEYEKLFYDVLLPDGDVVVCWPNAGRMHFAEADVVSGHAKYRGKFWTPEAGVKIRVNREMNEG